MLAGLVGAEAGRQFNQVAQHINKEVAAQGLAVGQADAPSPQQRRLDPGVQIGQQLGLAHAHLTDQHHLPALPGGQFGFLVFVNLLVFFLAFFLDFFELAFIIIPLLGPAAEKLGIDLIWFGVILGVNMQTSFMHPPFGFALFYLRSVAPKESYLDRITGKRMEPITTGQIYWGAVPFVFIQVIMVTLVILFPAMVMHYKGATPKVDLDKIKIEVPQIELPPLDFGPPKIQ